MGEAWANAGLSERCLRDSSAAVTARKWRTDPWRRITGGVAASDPGHSGWRIAAVHQPPSATATPSISPLIRTHKKLSLLIALTNPAGSISRANVHSFLPHRNIPA